MTSTDQQLNQQLDQHRDEGPGEQANPQPLSMTYAVQSFDKTGPMRGPYMVCTGFVRAGWNVDILTILSDRNRDPSLAWSAVPVHKIGNGSKRKGMLRLALAMLRRRKGHITFSLGLGLAQLWLGPRQVLVGPSLRLVPGLLLL